jgi:hypothetical protein
VGKIIVPFSVPKITQQFSLQAKNIYIYIFCASTYNSETSIQIHHVAEEKHKEKVYQSYDLDSKKNSSLNLFSSLVLIFLFSPPFFQSLPT